ncbi:MAG TPA: helix-turn-helix domain-containing protein [Puia sp.]
MTNFRFNSVEPHPLLSPYVAKLWVFESSGRLPAQERKLIVPNANLKMTLTYRNGIAARVGAADFLQRENGLTLTGLIDGPVTLDATEDARTGTIIIEFNPLGAYRLFHFSLAEVNNQIVDLGELIGSAARELQERLAGAGRVATKLELLQQFLLKRLETGAPDPIYDYCINRISYSRGLISLAKLEKETGYSSRWLQRKFSAHLGTSPKTLAEIVRFKQFYQAYSTGAPSRNLKSLIYEYYYDQSHFLRAFKRFTGTTPTELQNSVNELSTRNFSS